MLSWVPIIPVLLQILGWALKWFGASEETIRQYKALIVSTANDGKLTVNIKDSVKKKHQDILDELEKEANGTGKAT